MLAPAKPQTRVGVFDLAAPTRVRRVRRRSPGNRRVKTSVRRRLASKPCFGANGELQTKTDASGATEYTYDSFGNLRNVTPPTGAAIDYVIDGMNRRVGRKVGGTLVQGLLYQNQLNAVAELDGAGNLVAQYTYGTKPNVPDLKTDDTGSYRILSDHLGSPRLVVNTANGTVIERMDFDEWGNVTADASPATTPFGFAGGLYEVTTGLTRFGARDYQASSGRWTSKDPIRFDGGQVNIYAYVGDEPINRIDPFGKGEFGGGGSSDSYGDDDDDNGCAGPMKKCPKTGGGSGICNADLSTTCTFQCTGEMAESKKVPVKDQKDGYKCQYKSQGVDPNKTCPDYY